MIIFSLIKTNSFRNNELFKRNLTKSKGNRIIKMGSLFLTSSLICNNCKFRSMRLTQFCPRKMNLAARFFTHFFCLFVGAKVVPIESAVKVKFGNSFFTISNTLIIKLFECQNALNLFFLGDILWVEI
jgi:hypothetical protein